MPLFSWLLALIRLVHLGPSPCLAIVRYLHATRSLGVPLLHPTIQWFQYVIGFRILPILDPIPAGNYIRGPLVSGPLKGGGWALQEGSFKCTQTNGMIQHLPSCTCMHFLTYGPPFVYRNQGIGAVIGCMLLSLFHPLLGWGYPSVLYRFRAYNQWFQYTSFCEGHFSLLGLLEYLGRTLPSGCFKLVG